MNKFQKEEIPVPEHKQSVENFYNFIHWYEEERKNSLPKIYLTEFRGWKGFIQAYKPLQDPSILPKELKFNFRCMAKLKEYFKEVNDDKLREEYSILILSLKNRAEYISNQSDFYPIYVTLLAFSFAFFGATLPLGYKLLLGVGLMVIIGVAINIRIKTRRSLAKIKEISNILESYEKKFISKKN